MTSLHHIYICLNNFQETKKFYLELFSILKLSHISTVEDYSLYTYGNDNIHIGIMPVSPTNQNDKFDKFRIGLSHIAFKVDKEKQIQEILEFVRQNNLEDEGELEVRTHHLIEMPTIVFYCPSGIKIEITL